MVRLLMDGSRPLPWQRGLGADRKAGGTAMPSLPACSQLATVRRPRANSTPRSSGGKRHARRRCSGPLAATTQAASSAGSCHDNHPWLSCVRRLPVSKAIVPAEPLRASAAFAPTHRVPWFLAKEKAKSA